MDSWYAVVTATTPNPFFKPKRCDKSIPVSNDGFERALKKQYCFRCKKGEEHDKD